MRLMKNTYLDFESIVFDNKDIKNMTCLGLLPDIPDKFHGTDYIIKRKVHDDELIEQIAYNIYENTDYWDILLALNGMTSMNQLPVNNDIVIIRADKKLQAWKDKGSLLNSIMTPEILLEKYNEFLILEEELNEKYRYINYISVEDMSELLADLESAKSTTKINKNLIVYCNL